MPTLNKNLLLLDNNVLNTPNLESLVDDLCEAGFGRGAKYVDPGAFNIVMMRYHNGDRAGFLEKNDGIFGVIQKTDQVRRDA